MKLFKILKTTVITLCLAVFCSLGIAVPHAFAYDLICKGKIPEAGLKYSVLHSQESGFMQEVKFRNAKTGNGVAKSSYLKYDTKNTKGQDIYRGGVSGMADVTLVDLSEFGAEPGSQISVMYDGQWGRGTCSSYR